MKLFTENFCMHATAEKKIKEDEKIYFRLFLNWTFNFGFDSICII